VSATTPVGRWETEKNVPTDGTVVRIARYLHTTASWILYNDNPNGRDA
jgi:hypothetical protein